tara:strand:- start:29 stop:1078 length:1050 start_codon:yes stop_codon:yes gene_type:complete
MKIPIQPLAILLIATLAMSCSDSKQGDQKPSPSAPDAVSQNLLVGTTEVSLTSFEHSFPVQGNIETDRNALIIPEFAGSVASIFLQEGDKVRKGDAILKINDGVLMANKAELENSLSLAKEMFERQERVWSQKIGKEVDYLQAKSTVESIQRALETLAATIEKTVVRAPFSGVLDRIFVKEGELASPPMPVVRVIDLSDLYIRAMVSDNYISSLAQGGKVVVEINGFQPIETQLRRIGSFINPANRSIDITVDLPQTENLIPNMVATVWITDLQLDSAITLQSSLVSQDAEGNDFVFVMSKGQAMKRELKTGIISEGKILVSDGLQVGDLVISRGGDRLVDGAQVTLIN